MSFHKNKFDELNSQNSFHKGKFSFRNCGSSTNDFNENILELDNFEVKKYRNKSQRYASMNESMNFPTPLNLSLLNK